MTIIDAQGREWPIAADLPLRTTLVLLQHAQALEEGKFGLEAFDAAVSGLHAVLRRSRPDVTKDDVIDAFSITEMARLLMWLFFRMRARAETPNGTEPAPANRNRTERRAATRKQKSLPPASPGET